MTSAAHFPFLLESIKVKDNRIHNLAYHQERIARSLKEHLGSTKTIDFAPIIADIVRLPDILFKLRLIYNDSFLKYEFVPYQLKDIHSLKCIYTSKVDYAYKYLNRWRLDSLYSRKGSADDILIIKENMITDSYYCNVALEQDGKWYTPKTPLLKGTKRQLLIDEEVIIEAPLSVLDLSKYKHVRLFNAMIDFGEVEVPVSNIL